MARLPEVIGLLYRADWTRLSLSAEVRSETDRNLLPPLSPDEPSRWYRPRPAQTQEEEWSRWHRAWSGRPAATDGPPPLPVKVNGSYPPVPELLCPSCLLGGYTLEELGLVTVAGRDAIAVAATPRRDVLGSD